MSSQEPTTKALDTILLELADDPWQLERDERRFLHSAFADAQNAWLPRLNALTEPPEAGPDFPAFLLETAPFADLRTALGEAYHRRDLDTKTADTVQRFVDRYRDYLCTDR